MGLHQLKLSGFRHSGMFAKLEVEYVKEKHTVSFFGILIMAQGDQVYFITRNVTDFSRPSSGVPAKI